MRKRELVDVKRRGAIKRRLVVAAVVVVGVAAWAGAASAATTLSLCVSAKGEIRADTSCKTSETQFNAVSATDFNAVAQRVTTLEGKVNTLQTQVTSLQGRATPSRRCSRASPVPTRARCCSPA